MPFHRHSFNGATTFQSWKRDPSRSGELVTARLQWSHNFSVVETARQLCRHDRQFLSFNGATTFQSWKHAQDHRSPPRPLCFNGATTFQSWKHPTLFDIVDRWSGFNGATTFQSWKPETRHGRMLIPCRFNGATTFQSWKHQLHDRDLHTVIRASMEPQLFSRGNFLSFYCPSCSSEASMEPQLFSRGNGGRVFAVGEYSAFSSTSAHHPHG